MKNAGKKQAEQLTEAQLTYQRIMKHRMSVPDRSNGRDYGTNWSPDGAVKHVKKDHMLGEGCGNYLGLDAPKHTRSYGPGELDALVEADLRYEMGLKFKQSLRRQRNTAIQQRFRATLPEKISSGKILVQQRVFMAYPKDWEKRAARLGGLPQGVDIAKSEFGHLILVPVIEAKESSYKDALGRRFQIEPNLKQTINQIFGAVKWTRPLTLDEVKQFGIEVE